MMFQVFGFPPLLDDFRFAEAIGLENGWIADHFSWVPTPDLPLLEAWTTLAAVAGGTERIRIGPMVTNVATRNPGMLAKQALTLDHLSGGRLEMAIGGGFFQREHEMLGIDFPDAKGRVVRLREAAEILDTALRGSNVTFKGEHYQLDDAPIRPLPTQLPRPPLWVAAEGAGSLRAAARFGDAVICMGEGDDIDACIGSFRDQMLRIDEFCLEQGRDRGSIRRCYFAGFAGEPAFSSAAVAEDFIGRLVAISATDFVIPLANPGNKASVDSPSWCSRDLTERLAADVLPRYQHA